MGFASDVNVHQQTDDRALEVVVHPYVAPVVVIVHEVEPDVIAALSQTCMALTFVGSVEAEVSGEQFQGFFGCCDTSISQQTVTILEEYLALRPASKSHDMPESNSRPDSGGNREYLRYSEDPHDETDYLSRFRRVMDEISEFPPIPISERCPRTDVLLAQIREEEAG